MEISELLKDMVLIKQNYEFRVINNSGRFSEQKPGFYIQSPIAGFVEKNLWESIDIFQKINIKESDVLNRMIKVGQEITEEDLLKHTDLQKWLDLQNKTKCFCSIIEEFNILVAINMKKEEIWCRTFCELGKSVWSLCEL
jgi:hypothetical protein